MPASQGDAKSPLCSFAHSSRVTSGPQDGHEEIASAPLKFEEISIVAANYLFTIAKLLLGLLGLLGLQCSCNS